MASKLLLCTTTVTYGGARLTDYNADLNERSGSPPPLETNSAGWRPATPIVGPEAGDGVDAFWGADVMIALSISDEDEAVASPKTKSSGAKAQAKKKTAAKKTPPAKKEKKSKAAAAAPRTPPPTEEKVRRSGRTQKKNYALIDLPAEVKGKSKKRKYEEVDDDFVLGEEDE